MRDSRFPLACIVLLYGSYCQAQSIEMPWQVCENPEALPLFRALPIGEPVDPETLPTYIYADELDIQKVDESVFEGNVELERGVEWLSTDKLFYTHQTEQYRTEGAVKFQNATLLNTFFKNNDRMKRVQFIDCKVDKITYAFLKSNQANMTGITLLP